MCSVVTRRKKHHGLSRGVYKVLNIDKLYKVRPHGFIFQTT
jgi:hypothetical protein